MNLITKINEAANKITKGEHTINDIPIYIDPHSDKNNILVGRKGDQPKANYIIMNPVIYNELFFEEMTNRDRFDKLSKILKDEKLDFIF